MSVLKVDVRKIEMQAASLRRQAADMLARADVLDAKAADAKAAAAKAEAEAKARREAAKAKAAAEAAAKAAATTMPAPIVDGEHLVLAQKDGHAWATYRFSPNLTGLKHDSVPEGHVAFRSFDASIEATRVDTYPRGGFNATALAMEGAWTDARRVADAKEAAGVKYNPLRPENSPFLGVYMLQKTVNGIELWRCDRDSAHDDVAVGLYRVEERHELFTISSFEESGTKLDLFKAMARKARLV